MLTGKDIYEAFKRYGVTLDIDDASAYGVVADIINASYITPLQGQVEALQMQNDKLTADMKVLRDLDRKIFDDQEKRQCALKGLVKDWHAWAALHFVTETTVLDTPWRKQYRELDAYTRSLLAEKEQ